MDKKQVDAIHDQDPSLDVDGYEERRGHLVRNWVVIVMVAMIVCVAWSKGYLKGVFE